MRLLGDRMSRRTAWRIAREQDWETIYHAEYIAVTRLQADALVTVDPSLSAKAEGLVPLAPLGALSTDD
jgi:predicted nucleic acid-binding protein